MGDDDLEQIEQLVGRSARQIAIAIHALRWELAVARLSVAPDRLAAAKPDITPASIVRFSLSALLLGGDLGEPDRSVRGLVLDRDERRAWVCIQHPFGHEVVFCQGVDTLELE